MRCGENTAPKSLIYANGIEAHWQVSALARIFFSRVVSGATGDIVSETMDIGFLEPVATVTCGGYHFLGTSQQ